MRLGASRGDDFIAHLFREGDIHQRVAVDVADLTATDDVFQAAEIGEAAKSRSARR